MGTLSGGREGPNNLRCGCAELAISGACSHDLECKSGEIRSIEEDVLGPCREHRLVHPNERSKELRSAACETTRGLTTGPERLLFAAWAPALGNFEGSPGVATSRGHVSLSGARAIGECDRRDASAAIAYGNRELSGSGNKKVSGPVIYS